MNKQALRYLCFISLLLFGAPKVNIKIGPVPFYLIDFIIFLTIILSRNLPAPSYKIPYKKLVNFILFMIVLNELFNGLINGIMFEPLYIIIRMILAFNLFFVIPRIIQKPKDLRSLIYFGMIGGLISSVLLITSSLPMTRAFSSFFLTNPILNPGASFLISSFEQAGSNSLRGTSLIGVSILSGAFLNVLWPLLFLIIPYAKSTKRFLLNFTITLIPVSIIMTYSRGALLAILLIIIGLVYFQKGKYRIIIFSLLSLIYLSISFIGWDSKIFKFDRIEKRTVAIIQNPYENERESERILAYVEPFEHLVSNPFYLILGEGFAANRILDEKSLTTKNARADHAVFARAYYAYGFITSLAIISLYILILRLTYRKVKKSYLSNNFSSKTIKIIFVLLIGFTSWIAFGHAAISQPRGTILMFFVYGLVISYQNIHNYEYKENLNYKAKLKE